METAIPDHLLRPRTRAPWAGEDHVPPYPSHTARFAPASVRIVMAYFGVQYRDGGTVPDVVGPALTALDEALSGPEGAGRHDHAEYVDEAGFRTHVVVAYWRDPDAFARWRDTVADWTAPERAGRGAGFFSEIVQPSVERFQTLVAHDRVDGVAHIADTISGEIREHGYWGAAHDRIPLAQDDHLHPGDAAVVVTEGALHRVRPADNACLVRFDVDWSGARGHELEVFHAVVEPALEAGMAFLRDEGAAIGCLDNRHMRLLDAAGEPMAHTVSVSWWRGIADLNAWAGGHRTHLAIFDAAMRFLGEIGPTARLRLHQEVTVASADEQSFTYLDCHTGTGALRAGEQLRGS